MSIDQFRVAFDKQIERCIQSAGGGTTDVSQMSARSFESSTHTIEGFDQARLEQFRTLASDMADSVLARVEEEAPRIEEACAREEEKQAEQASSCSFGIHWSCGMVLFERQKGRLRTWQQQPSAQPEKPCCGSRGLCMGSGAKRRQQGCSAC